MNRHEFIDKAWEAATKARTTGATISVPIAVAQAALETGFGRSRLATDHNNLFGIKGEYKGNYIAYPTKEQDDQGNIYEVMAKFKSYPSWTACFEDYASIIERLPWYQDAEDAAHIPHDYLAGLVAVRNEGGHVEEPGWATDHHYYDKVWGIVEEYDLLDRSETTREEEIELLIIYDKDRKLILNPSKCTFGMTNDGRPKLMVRVQPTTFMQRFRYLLGWQEAPRA